MDWLYEGQLKIYLVLGTAAVLSLVFWWQNQGQRFWLAVAGSALVMLGLYYGLDRLVQTDQETLASTVEIMTDSVEKRNLDAAFQHIADNFISPGGRSRDEFRQLAEQEIRSGRVHGVKIWDIRFPEGVSRTGSTRVTFLFKLRADLGGREELFFLCDAQFRFHPQRGWQLTGCKILDPTKENEEFRMF